MYLLTFESRKALERKLLHVVTEQEDNSEGLQNLFDRWVDFRRELMESEELNHLWPNKHFRDAYFSVTQFEEVIDAFWRDPENFKIKSGFINKIIDEIEEDDVAMFELLLEAAKLIANTKNADSEEHENYKNLIKDLEAFAIISRCYAECLSVREKYGAELIDLESKKEVTSH